MFRNTIYKISSKKFKTQQKFCSTSASKDQLKLTIQNPASFLNHISERYISTGRIIMEFIDNSIDDAEQVYRANQFTYPSLVEIKVIIDRKNKSLRIIDNCRGMSIEQLHRLVENVGESKKKTVPWLNGKFGFGVHSFRAAAKTLTIISKQEDNLPFSISIAKTDVNSINPPTGSTLPFPHQNGTEIILEHFNKHWWKGVDAKSLCSEIEQHFERILSRDNLKVVIIEISDGLIISESVCKPIDYDSIPGKKFKNNFFFLKIININLFQLNYVFQMSLSRVLTAPDSFFLVVALTKLLILTHS